jgi:predicted transcriptional regulator
MMATLNGAILRVLSDGKYYTIKNLRHAILDNTTLYEGDIPKSTLWYHLLKLQKEGKVKSKSYDGSNRVEYYIENTDSGTRFIEENFR